MPIRAALAGLALVFVLAPPASATLANAEGLAFTRLAEPTQPEAFAVPLRGPLHSPFGYRWGRLHAGLDIAVLGSDRVRAALSGVVVANGYLDHYSGYGHTVKIKHSPRMTTLYAHLASADVRVGQRVGTGDKIARAGCTGSCTGPHLHFEVRLRGEPVDPLPYLPRRAR